jgi:hypothetical protein
MGLGGKGGRRDSAPTVRVDLRSTLRINIKFVSWEDGDRASWHEIIFLSRGGDRQLAVSD